MITKEDGTPQYRFITNKQKGFERVSAKSPMDMLPLTIDNDINEVIKYVESYINGEEEEVVTETTPKEETKTEEQ